MKREQHALPDNIFIDFDGNWRIDGGDKMNPTDVPRHIVQPFFPVAFPLANALIEAAHGGGKCSEVLHAGLVDRNVKERQDALRHL
jgi:hypothetical protein